MSDTDRILSIEQVQRLRNFFSGTDEDDQIAAVPQHMFIELLDSHDAQQVPPFARRDSNPQHASRSPNWDAMAHAAVEVVARRLGCSVEELEGLRLRKEQRDDFEMLRPHQRAAGLKPLHWREQRFVSGWKPVEVDEHA